jgi:hypothetical protein
LPRAPCDLPSICAPTIPSFRRAAIFHRLSETHGPIMNRGFPVSLDSIARTGRRWESSLCSAVVSQFAVLLDGLLIIRCNSERTAAFRRTISVGSLCRIASNTAPVVSPLNGKKPVAISYKTAPKENRSVLASSAFHSPAPATCTPRSLPHFPGSSIAPSRL